MKLLYALAVTTALVATPALAQEEAGFGGLYAGALVGYDHVTIDDGADSGSKDGVAFSALLGYDYDLGSAVAGIEGEIGDSSANVTESDVLVAGDRGKLSADLDLYVGARLGFKVAPSTLIYAKGGYTRTRVSLDYTSGTTTFKDHDNLDGYRIGVGIEQSFGRIGVRAEYRYSDYGNYFYGGVNTGLSARRHQVVLAAVGKF